MKKTNVILMLVVLCTLTSVCWGQSYWKRTYAGAPYFDVAYAITPTLDGNFIVVGTKYLSNNGVDIYLLKIKPNGDTLWTKTYGGTGDDGAFAITPTFDGNFMVAGHTGSLGIGNSRVCLLKIKSDGDTLWTKTFGETLDYLAYDITPTIDGNFIVVGAIYDGNGNYNVYLLKIKPDGDTLWTKIYGKTTGQEAMVMPTSDGNFIAVNTTSFIGGYSVYLLKIKPNGDTLWTKTYGTGYTFAFGITPTSDGSCIVVGRTSSVGDSSSEVYLLKIKLNGDTLWTKTYGGTGDGGAFAITPTSDGNFIVAGRATSNAGFENICLLKIKPNGDILWTKTNKGTGWGGTLAITPNSDGNFIVAGNINSLNAGGVYLFSIIDDRYAYKNTPFTFKIPVSGDSLNHGYTPLKVPSGMKVSLGSTISWTPKTDSVYMDHGEFLVFDDIGNKDTLTFNIFVNSSYKPAAIKPASRFIARKNQSFNISQTSASQIKFNLPSGATSLDIFDMRGRQVQHISPTSSFALWNKTTVSGTPVPAGKYFAKIKGGSGVRDQGFMVVR